MRHFWHLNKPKSVGNTQNFAQILVFTISNQKRTFIGILNQFSFSQNEQDLIQYDPKTLKGAQKVREIIQHKIKENCPKHHPIIIKKIIRKLSKAGQNIFCQMWKNVDGRFPILEALFAPQEGSEIKKRHHNFWRKHLRSGHSVRKEGGRGGHGKKKYCAFLLALQTIS